MQLAWSVKVGLCGFRWVRTVLFSVCDSYRDGVRVFCGGIALCRSDFYCCLLPLTAVGGCRMHFMLVLTQCCW